MGVAIYMFMFWFVSIPLVASWMMARGSRLPLVAEDSGLLDTFRSHWRSYVWIGLLGMFYFIMVWTSISYIGVLAIANAADGTVLGLRRSDSVWVAVAVNLPVMIAAAREFKLSARSVCGPRERSTARHTKGTSLELR